MMMQYGQRSSSRQILAFGMSYYRAYTWCLNEIHILIILLKSPQHILTLPISSSDHFNDRIYYTPRWSIYSFHAPLSACPKASHQTVSPGRLSKSPYPLLHTPGLSHLGSICIFKTRHTLASKCSGHQLAF